MESQFLHKILLFLFLSEVTCVLISQNVLVLLQKVVGLFFGGMSAGSTLSVVFVVIYGANLTITGSMTPGSLTSFILYSLTGFLMFLSVPETHYVFVLKQLRAVVLPGAAFPFIHDPH